MTKIFQLFRANIPEDLLIKIYICFGIRDLDDDHLFSKADLLRLETVKQLTGCKEELSQYYLPCKAKLYLNELTVNKSITILRQVLRLFQMTLASKQKYIKHKKTTFYYIAKNIEVSEDIHTMKVDNHTITVNFS